MKHLKWLLPLLFFAALAPFTPAIDLYVSSLFFTETFYDNAFFNFLYKYGELVGFAIGGFVGIVLLLSFVKKEKWIKWRAGALMVLLTLVIGAGVITNSCFKEYWGRPRPKQIVEFGGHHAYRPFWYPHLPSKKDPQKSFPSGHVAMGFYYLSLCLAAKRYGSRALWYTGLFLTLFWGGGLMVGRVVQGAHFVSDVLAAALLMWLVALTIDHWVWKKQELIG